MRNPCGLRPHCLESAVLDFVSTVVVIAIVTVIHLLGIKVASWVNDVGVVGEIAGATIRTIFLVLFAPSSTHGLAILADTTNDHTNLPVNLSGFALSLLMGAWCLTGFEASADPQKRRNSRVV